MKMFKTQRRREFGYFFNEFLMGNALRIPILILGLLVVSILAG